MTLPTLVTRGLYFLSLAALSILIYTVSPYVAIASNYPFVSTLNRILAIVIVVLIFEWVRTHLKLKTQSAQLAQTPVDPQDTLGQFKKSFTAALQFLRNTKVMIEGKKRPLIQAPWFIVIGPAGAGKSSLLAHSGQKFVLAKKLACEQFKRIKATRFCDWWVTKQAVIVDLAGDFFWPQKNVKLHQKLWRTFLDLLKHSAPGSNIKAVFVTFDLPDYLQQSDEARTACFKALRSRLQGLNTAVGKHLNVIVLFNKCDKLTGFEDFFAQIDKTTRDNVLGFELAHCEGDNLINRCQAGLEQLIDTLNTSVIPRMHQEHNIDKRAHIKAFPAQLALAKEAILTLLSELPNTQQDKDALLQLNLHGVFFTSSTQNVEEAEHYDQLLAPLTQAFELQTVPQFTNTYPAKNYFTHALFSNVIFNIKTAPPKYASPVIKKLRYSAYGLATVAVFGLTTWFASAFYQHVQKIYETQAALNAYQVLSRQQSQDVMQLQAMVPALDALQKAYLGFSNKDNVLLNPSQSAQTPLLPILRQTYLNVLQNRLLPLIGNTLGHQLETDLQTPDASPQAIYQTLKLYLRLSQSASKDKEHIKQWVSDYWLTKNLGNQENLHRLLGHINVAFAFSNTDFKINRDLVTQAQARLEDLSLAQRTYLILEDEAKHNLPALSLIPSEFANAQRFLQFFKVPKLTLSPFYTAAGFNSILNQRLESAIQQARTGNGILPAAQEANDTNETIITDVAQRYQTAFVQQWQTVFESFSLNPVNNLQDLNTRYYLLTQAHSPLNDFLNSVKTATQLSLTHQGKYNTALSNMVLSINANFAPLHQLADNLNQTATRNAILTPIVTHANLTAGLLHARDKNYQAYRYAKTTFEAPKGKASFVQENRNIESLPNPIKNWLMPLEHTLWTTILKMSSEHIQLVWQHDILPKFKLAITQKYPVTSNSDEHISMTDFNLWLNPTGQLNQFVTQTLSPFVDTNSTPWRLNTVAGAHLPLSIENLRAIEAAIEIAKQFYPSDKTQAQFNFDLNAKALSPNVKGYILNIHGNQMDYPNGLTSISNMLWPSAKPDTEYVKILFTLDNGKTAGFETRGDFALFKLLEKAQIEKTKQPNQYLVTFHTQDAAVKYELLTHHGANPLAIDFTKTFTLPESLSVS